MRMERIDPSERPARIALVIGSLAGGGAERVLSALAAHWSRAGHDVSVLTIGSSDTDVYALAPGVRRVALGLYNPSAHPGQGLVRGIRRVAVLRRTIRRIRPDVVVSFLTPTNVAAILACWGTHVPVVVSERVDPQLKAGTIWSALRRALYPTAAGVVVQNESIASWARRFCSRVHVIPNLVVRPERRAEPGRDHGPMRLVAMGRLMPQKGFDLLVDAFARVAPAHPDWSLTILGEGPQRAELETLVVRSRLQGRVLMPGRVADPVPELLKAQAFVLPSRFEGFPNALIEAMACGLPPVAFDCPSGPADIISHGTNGLLVAAGDVTALAAALSRMMGSATERARMGEEAREFTRLLSPERVLPRWSAVLEQARKHA
jgi:glycosyltransferase involved in cell wall biosynthesis